MPVYDISQWILCMYVVCMRVCIYRFVYIERWNRVSVKLQSYRIQCIHLSILIAINCETSQLYVNSLQSLSLFLSLVLTLINMRGSGIHFVNIHAHVTYCDDLITLHCHWFSSLLVNALFLFILDAGRGVDVHSRRVVHTMTDAFDKVNLISLKYAAFTQNICMLKPKGLYFLNRVWACSTWKRRTLNVTVVRSYLILVLDPRDEMTTGIIQRIIETNAISIAHNKRGIFIQITDRRFFFFFFVTKCTRLIP